MNEKRESTTAKICSFARAMHSCSKCNKIFDDYLAFNMIGEKQMYYLQNIISECFTTEEQNKQGINFCVNDWLNRYFTPIILSRSAFAEKRLEIFAKKYEHCQYVILGAGLDTFSFRNKNKNIRIFEVDHPSTQMYKKSRLSELNWKIPENVNFVSIDFESENIKKLLYIKDFNKSLPTFFTILGVTYYISFDIFENIIETISQITDYDKEMIIDFPDETTYTNSNNRRAIVLSFITDLLGEKMKQGFSYSDIENMLNKHNFCIEEYLNPKEIQKVFFESRNNEQKAYENVCLIAAKYNKEV